MKVLANIQSQVNKLVNPPQPEKSAAKVDDELDRLLAELDEAGKSAQAKPVEKKKEEKKIEINQDDLNNLDKILAEIALEDDPFGLKKKVEPPKKVDEDKFKLEDAELDALLKSLDK
jgi:hypothetical protein